MKLQQCVYQEGSWSPLLQPNSAAQLVLAFGDRQLYASPHIQQQLRQAFPEAEVIGGSTCGEVMGGDVLDNCLCLTVIEFERAGVSVVSGVQPESSSLPDFLAGLAAELPGTIEAGRLRYVLVLANGHSVNGSELVHQLNQLLPEGVSVSGGLTGDNARFLSTFVWHNAAIDRSSIVLCGFYGDSLQVSHSSVGGWYPFGPERIVTASEGNVLYSLDNRPALDLYKNYLGDHARDLPASALLFPLQIKQDDHHDIIRTVIGIDEEAKTMTFAGDIPQGSTVVLMHGNYEGLIDGARVAAEDALQDVVADVSAGLVFIVSCVGRKLVLNRRVDEEVEAVQSIFGQGWCYAGFYSHGEIAPIHSGQNCDFHNETITLTAIAEQ